MLRRCVRFAGTWYCIGGLLTVICFLIWLFTKDSSGKDSNQDTASGYLLNRNHG